MPKTCWISLLVAASGLSASSQTAPTINACVNNLNGVPRLVAASTNCVSGVETFKQWNVTGPQGPQGAQGPAGTQGPQGFTGSPGARGATGFTGPAGTTGPSGNTGAQGPQGQQGDTGAQGPQGVTGLQGSAGATGSQGPRGDLGPTGNTGAQGEKGPAGPSGPTGPAGAAGGQVWSAVTTMPTNFYATTDYFFSPTGQSVVTNTQHIFSVALPVPVSCTATNFNTTLFGGAGTKEAITSLFGIFDPQGVLGDVKSLCTMPFISNALSTSCSDFSDAIALTSGEFIAVGFQGTTDASFANASLAISFTCQ